MKETRLKIALDVDDCLLVPSVATGFPRDTPNYARVNIKVKRLNNSISRKEWNVNKTAPA